MSQAYHISVNALKALPTVTLSAGGDLLALIADLVGAEAVPEEFFNIGEGGIGDVREGFRREERLMGGDDHVGHGDEAREDVIIDDMARMALVPCTFESVLQRCYNCITQLICLDCELPEILTLVRSKSIRIHPIKQQ